MKKSTALLPLLLFLPIVMVLYVCVEHMLDTMDTDLDEELTDSDSTVSTTRLDSQKLSGNLALDRVDFRRNFNRSLDNALRMNVKDADEGKALKEEKRKPGKDGDGGNIVHLRQKNNEQNDTERNNGQERNGESEDGGQITFPPFVDNVDVSRLGEDGKAAPFNASQLTGEEKKRYDEGWARNSFNQYLSDRISVRRSLPHGWGKACQEASFRSDLPQASVIIIFHNEAWSVLLRSVHSVLSRTPHHLLREVILVDDYSTFGHLEKPLEKYWASEPRVKIIHAAKREGLTRARLLGYQAATAPVLVFFDSHIECFPGWYEPLADRIRSNPNITVFPSIEVINPDTFAVEANHYVDNVGTFRWRDLTFQWHAVTPEMRKHITSQAQPLQSPTMPGGLFAIDRDFFTFLGAYDPGLDYWGGENVEISFKAWMCYGSVELVPCSHVGHIFRRFNPIKWATNVGLKNVGRVAAVWMDDYKNYFLERNVFNVGDYGDVTDRQRLRESLKCRDFAWYVRNVGPLYIPPVHVLHAGELKNLGADLCMDSYAPRGDRPKLYGCHGTGGNQFWYIDKDGRMFQDSKLVCFKGGELLLDAGCDDRWNITRRDIPVDEQQVVHASTGLCLQGGKESEGGQPDLTVTLQPCDRDNKRHVWTIRRRRPELNYPLFD